MGRMKELFIEQQNNQRGMPDDTDWNYKSEEPAPLATQADGKKLYLVKSITDDVEYKIWAHSYAQALDLLPMIEGF